MANTPGGVPDLLNRLQDCESNEIELVVQLGVEKNLVVKLQGVISKTKYWKLVAVVGWGFAAICLIIIKG